MLRYMEVSRTWLHEYLNMQRDVPCEILPVEFRALLQKLDDRNATVCKPKCVHHFGCTRDEFSSSMTSLLSDNRVLDGPI